MAALMRLFTVPSGSFNRAATVVVPLGLAKHLREHFLNDVLRFGLDLHDPKRQRVDHAGVPVVERCESRAVTADGCGQRVAIAEGSLHQWTVEPFHHPSRGPFRPAIGGPERAALLL